MTHEEIAEQLYDELQHNKLISYKDYDKRLTELVNQAHPNEEDIAEYEEEVDTIAHNKYSFGFCDMCMDVILYDDDTWYDINSAEPEEQEILDETLPDAEYDYGNEIETVCSNCWHKLLTKEKGEDPSIVILSDDEMIYNALVEYEQAHYMSEDSRWQRQINRLTEEYYNKTLS